ncbi:hypothetical protein [Prosthecochloris sp. ZM_2]|uniref:hypothetical protein n=1 Tax=Prosthecochloris sp. ZM_2 TaxID=2045206 RepID=UPI0013149BA0|nr:hypothetical protein [Prosthecochloris sp. ZM_2]
MACTRTAIPLRSIAAGDTDRSPALRSGERGRGSGIHVSARRRANTRLEQTRHAEK